ncbi:MAG TPA: hypothetical protein VEG65_02875 [Candidatus Bathyarchaeia archaeon]|nr:hypothetical protein [Candidatus Bathyarchaeia archaeon]
MNTTTIRNLYTRILPNETAALLFYASLAVTIAIWNINIFINDEVTLAAELINLVRGTLWIEVMPTKLYQGLSFGTSAPILGFPFQGHTYAFYTHAVPVFATPFYAFLWLLSVTVGIRLFFAAFWSFSLFMVGVLAGKRWHRPRLGRDGGAFVALALFIANIYVGTRLPPLVFDQWGALMAIQLFNIVATSAIVLLSLRIFSRYFADDRIAAFGAAYILIATPLTFWAVSAKDHTASVLLIVASFWSLYMYLQDDKKRYRYLSYVFVGLSVWVRVFDAIPLFIAIILTDVLTSRARIKAVITAVATVLFAMIPYFINNYLLFNNPFLSPVYLSANPEIAQPSPINVATWAALLSTVERLPTLFLGAWSIESIPSWPSYLYHVFFNAEGPVTLSVFQICPLLIIPLFAAVPYVASKLSRSAGPTRLKVDKERAIAVGFFVYIIAHIVVYAGSLQNQGFGLDMRYFLPLYIPLLFFTLASIREVLVHSSRIKQGFAAAWVALSGFVLAYAAIFGPTASALISALGFSLSRAFGTITAISMALFLPYLVGYKKRLKDLAILVGFATFVSSYWLVVACWLWQKTPIGVPRPGMMLPVMEIIHRVIIAAIAS